MGLIAKDKGEYTLIPEGTHPARCYLVADIGTQTSQFGDAHQCVIGWEVWHSEDESAPPDTIHAFYTVSLNSKANLRKDLTGWRGKAFTQAELDGFDLSKLIAAPCQVTVAHVANAEGKVRAKVSGLASASRLKVPDLTCDTVLIDDPTQAPALPEHLKWIAEKIDECAEMKHASLKAPAPSATTQPGGPADDDADDIPF